METVETNNSTMYTRSALQSSIDSLKPMVKNFYKSIQARFNLILIITFLVLVIFLVSYIIITTFFNGIENYMFIFQYCTIFTTTFLLSFALYSSHIENQKH